MPRAPTRIREEVKSKGDLEELKRPLRAFLKAKGLHESKTRDLVVDTFVAADEHLGLEAILEKVRVKNPGVGMATVYRTMRLLEEAGFVLARDFGRGSTLYEVAAGRPHHDHLVCERCGVIVEFVSEPIEKLQEKVAAEHGFELKRHHHEHVRALRALPAPRLTPSAAGAAAPRTTPAGTLASKAQVLLGGGGGRWANRSRRRSAGAVGAFSARWASPAGPAPPRPPCRAPSPIARWRGASTTTPR
jgi:Fur family ferric uptake transcriptional regulator